MVKLTCAYMLLEIVFGLKVHLGEFLKKSNKRNTFTYAERNVFVISKRLKRHLKPSARHQLTVNHKLQGYFRALDVEHATVTDIPGDKNTIIVRKMN